MAAVKKAGQSHDNKGRFRSNKEVDRRKKFAKIPAGRVSGRDEAVCFESDYKISGRRVVEVDLLAEALDSGCNTCAEPLQLSNVTDETVSGLGSFLYITCRNPDCGEINVCQTNKTHRVASKMRGRPIFDVNTKLAAGLLRDFVADRVTVYFYLPVCPITYPIIQYSRHATRRIGSNACKCVVIFTKHPFCLQVHVERKRA